MAFSRRKAMLACALGLTTLPVWAQDYPNRTITMVIPFPTGPEHAAFTAPAPDIRRLFPDASGP